MTWVLNATITAEEKGVTMANVDATSESLSGVPCPACPPLPCPRRCPPPPPCPPFCGGLTKDPEVLRLLGADFAYNIIKSVGSYGELVERNIGERSIDFNFGSQGRGDPSVIEALASSPPTEAPVFVRSASRQSAMRHGVALCRPPGLSESQYVRVCEPPPCS